MDASRKDAAWKLLHSFPALISDHAMKMNKKKCRTCPYQLGRSVYKGSLSGMSPVRQQKPSV